MGKGILLLIKVTISIILLLISTFSSFLFFNNVNIEIFLFNIGITSISYLICLVALMIYYFKTKNKTFKSKLKNIYIFLILNKFLQGANYLSRYHLKSLPFLNMTWLHYIFQVL